MVREKCEGTKELGSRWFFIAAANTNRLIVPTSESWLDKSMW